MIGSIQADQDTSFQAMEHAAEAVRRHRAAPIRPSRRDRVHRRARRTRRTPAACSSRSSRSKSARLERRRGDRAGCAGKLAKIPGGTLFLQAVQDLRIGGRASSAQYQYTLQGDNLDDLNDWGPKVLREMRKLPAWSTSTPISRIAACKRGLTSTD